MTELTFPAEAQAELNRLWSEVMGEIDGSARQALWECRDGWIVGYTTSRIVGGPPKIRGRFAAMAYKPVGKGARSGTATSHERIYLRGFSTRKAARARAERMYEQHSK